MSKAREYELTGRGWIGAGILLLIAVIVAIGATNRCLDGGDIPPPAHPTRDLSQSIATVSTDYDLDVVGEVVDNCERLGLPPTLCLGVVFQEGGLVRSLWPSAIGDGGESCGPLQINKIHWTDDKQCSYWFDVTRSFDLMGSRWQWAFDRQGGWGYWQTDPVNFLRWFAPDAQGSIGWSYNLALTNLTLADGAYADYLTQPPIVNEGADPCTVAQALNELVNQQLGVTSEIDESTFLANLARIQSNGHPIGSAYSQLAQRLLNHRNAVQGLAEAIQYEAWLLCPPTSQPIEHLPVDAALTQPFGITPFVQANPGLYRIPPGHSGLDFGAGAGTPIRALRSGTVVYAGWRNYYGQPVNDGTGYGLVVAVEEGANVWWYAHQSRIDVAVGQQITSGQQLGLVGSTGRSTGAHLHFELRQNGNVIDPLPFLGWTPAIAVAPEGEELPHD